MVRILIVVFEPEKEAKRRIAKDMFVINEDLEDDLTGHLFASNSNYV